MKFFLKIILLIVLCLPIWLTIVAVGAPQSGLTLKDAVNSNISAEQNRRIQILEILPARLMPPTELLSQKFSVEFLDVRPRGVSQIGLKFSDSEGRLQNYFRLPARLLVQERMAVANRKLPVNTPITQSDFTIEWKEASSGRDSALDGSTLVGRTTRKALDVGQIILESDLKPFRMVERGARVKVKISGPGITLTGVGVAREPGSKGDTIRVLNTESKKEIMARVIENNLVEVRL